MTIHNIKGNIVIETLVAFLSLMAITVVSQNGTMVFLSNQTCTNCWNGYSCVIHYNTSNTTWPVTLAEDCWNICSDLDDCYGASLGEDSYCILFNCTNFSQKIGSQSYRRTNNTDCREFEIYVHTGYRGNCTAIVTETNVYSEEKCLERCLETPNCRGSTYDISRDCFLHDSSCSEKESDFYSTYIERQCLDEQPPCNRNYIQECVNCKTADPLCPLFLFSGQDFTPLSYNLSAIEDRNVGMNQLWYNPWYSHYYLFECTYVKQKIGHTVFRSTCTTDCPKFELLTLDGHRGTCPESRTLSGGVDINFCTDKCLDMANCRGVSFNTTSKDCTFHSCNNYTVEDGVDFISRRCIDGPECSPEDKVIQTCIGCEAGPHCPRPFTSDKIQALYTNCEELKESDNESIVITYNRSQSECNRYQCEFVRQKMGLISYRESCNTDCPKFEIFTLGDYGGSCPIIHSEEGGFNMNYCNKKCLDMNLCRAISYNRSTGRCDYHNCTDHVDTPGMRFAWKRCIFDEPPPRDYQQICVGCNVNSVCQMPVNETVLPTWQECQNYFNGTDAIAELFMYNPSTHNCALINCTLVEQDEEMSRIAFRNSPTSDCPIYRLLTLYGYNGTCSVLGYEEGGVDLPYCIEKCLDLNGCRSVSHDNDLLRCWFHSCADWSEAENHTFVKRECISYQDFNPTKDYTQTCKNCQNMCSSSLLTQSNQVLYTNCNTSCMDCDVIVYEPDSNHCLKYQCDRPYIQGPGTTTIRKTTNPECLQFEIITKMNTLPVCKPFEYDEGVASQVYCLKRCMDLPGCLSVLYSLETRNCTYHACAEFEDAVNYVTDIMFIKNCLQENWKGCSAPVGQTCTNCKAGTLCQSPFQISNDTTDQQCKAAGSSEQDCEGIEYDPDNMTCTLYQCPFVTQQYESTFYRDSCNDDCRIHEVYILDRNKGICDVIPSMTEYMVLYPEICYNRCLDHESCRAVTYSSSTEICYYHTCDCYTGRDTVPGDVFMWKYCLDDTSAATVLPISNASSIPLTLLDLSDIYPVATDCSPPSIFIMPCQCSTGAFDNLTNEQIVNQLIKNLLIDADSTSLNYRKYNTAEDNRPVAIAFGTLSILVISSVIGIMIAIDLTRINFVKVLKNARKNVRRLYRRILNCKTNLANVCTSQTSIDSIEHLYAEDFDDLNDIEKKTN